MAVGKPYRYDPEYKRKWREQSLYDFRTPFKDFDTLKSLTNAEALISHISVETLWTRIFQTLKKVMLVCDNLNTHKPASLYKAFETHEADRIAEKLEFHYTPKHGSWLNMAEIEFSVLRRQCLSRRIPDQETLKHEVQAWQDRRNQQRASVNWRFTTDDARIKLKKLYPSINS